jgi:RecT family protein
MENKLTTQETPSISDAELITYLDSLGLTSKLTEPEKTAFLNIAKHFNLNPFKREIHISKYNDNISIITGYEVYLKRAERSGQLDGWSVTTEGSIEAGDLKAIVTIHRKDRTQPFVWEVFYSEAVQKTKEGAVTKFWQKGIFMTKKVAISQGFRLCFSDELAGMPYTADEIQPEETTYDIPHTEVQEATVIPTLTEKQFEKLLKSKVTIIGQHLDAIDEARLNVTTEQYQAIKAKHQELISQS